MLKAMLRPACYWSLTDIRERYLSVFSNAVVMGDNTNGYCYRLSHIKPFHALKSVV
uniref:Uncharacterized protein n=1 Tax=Anguilla anguilla TaxID=7936 RepID=A0A0E9WW16_ANGAN